MQLGRSDHGAAYVGRLHAETQHSIQRVKADAKDKRFKEFIESRGGNETGSWRGSVDADVTGSSELPTIFALIMQSALICSQLTTGQRGLHDQPKGRAAGAQVRGSDRVR